MHAPASGTAAAGDTPTGDAGPRSGAGAFHFRVRRSPLLTAASIGGAAFAAGSAVAGVLPWLGGYAAGALGCVLLAGLTAAARRHARAMPAELRLSAGGDWLAAYDRTARPLAAGRIAACVQWSDLLLALRLDGHRAGRRVARHSVLVMADALPAADFRRLCASARRSAGRPAGARRAGRFSTFIGRFRAGRVRRFP